MPPRSTASIPPPPQPIGPTSKIFADDPALFATLDRPPPVQVPAQSTVPPASMAADDMAYAEALAALIARKFRDAADMLTPLVARNPDNVEYQAARELALGHFHRSEGRIEVALRHYDRARVADPSCSDALEAITTLRGTRELEEHLLDRVLSNSGG